jgi:hypothetical protein
MAENPYSPPTAEVADIEGDTASLERPANVTNGIRVLWAQLALGLVALVVDGFTAPAEDPDDGMWIATLAGLAFTLVISGVVALFTWYAWKGRNWARIVHLVMLILGTLTTLFAIFASSWLFPGAPVDGTEFLDVSYVGQTLLNVAGVVLLFTPSANHWYRAMRGRGMT